MKKKKISFIAIIIISLLGVTISTQYKDGKELTFQAVNTTPKTSQPPAPPPQIIFGTSS